MLTLTLIDFIFIAVYIAIVLYLGFLSKKDETNEGFLIADRNLGTLENAATVVASNTGAGLILTAVALIYIFGVSTMWFFIGASTGYVIFGLFAAKLKRISMKKKFYTFADYFFDKYGRFVGFVAASMSLIIITVTIITQLIGGAKVLGSLTGLSFLYALLAITVTIGIYLILGGFKAVVKTDIAQAVAIIVLAGLLGIVMAKGSLFEILIEGFRIGQTIPLISIVGFILLGLLIPFASPELWQRVYASRSPRIVKRSFFLAAAIYIVVGILFLIVGLTIGADIRGIDPDLALVEGFAVLLPPGLIGLGLVMLFAAIMSSADTYFFTGISIILQDFYSRFREVSTNELVRLFRYSLVGLLVIGVIIAGLIKSVVSAAFISAGIFTVIAVPTVMSWLVEKTPGSAVVSGMVIGFVGTVATLVLIPITEMIIIQAFGFTVAGFVLGWLYDVFFVSNKCNEKV